MKWEPQSDALPIELNPPELVRSGFVKGFSAYWGRWSGYAVEEKFWMGGDGWMGSTAP